MIQIFKQFIYCNDNSDRNYAPPDKDGITPEITKDKLKTPDFFQQYGEFTKIGIQAPPGTKFYINDGKIPVIVGSTGTISIDFSDGGIVSKLYFDERSLNRIAQNNEFLLIVDTLTNEGGVLN